MIEERRHQTSVGVPVAGDHRGWIEFWWRQFNFAQRDAIDLPDGVNQLCAEQHAVRSTRMLHWHAIKMRPTLQLREDR